MTRIIGIKQLHKELKKVSEETRKGHSFLVVKNSKPVFQINPIDDEDEMLYSLEDFKKIQFISSDKDLSKNIDKIIYK